MERCRVQLDTAAVALVVKYPVEEVVILEGWA